MGRLHRQAAAANLRVLRLTPVTILSPISVFSEGPDA